VNASRDPELSILLALEAVRTTRDAGRPALREAEEALHVAVHAQRVTGSMAGEWDVAFHPDGGLLVGGDRARLLDPITGEVLLELPGPPTGDHYESVAVDDAGRYLAAGANGSGTVVLWDAVSGAEVRRFGGLGDTAVGLDFSPDGRLLAAVAGGIGGRVLVWEVASGTIVASRSDPGAWEVCCPPIDVSFDPEGRRLAVTTTDLVKVLDLAAGDWDAVLEGHDSWVTAAEFLPGGRSVVTGSYDGTVRFWDAVSGTETGGVDAGVGQVISMAVGRDGETLLVGGDGGGVELWRLGSGGPEREAGLTGLRSFVTGMAFDTGGTLGAGVADGRVVTWDVTAGGRGEVAAWAGEGPVAFSDDGARLAAGGPGARDVVVVGTGDWQTLLVLEGAAPHLGPDRPAGTPEWGEVTGIDMSPDGSRIVTASSGYEVVPGTVTLWDGASGERIGDLLEYPFLKGPVAFAGAARVAAATCALPGSTASVWDVATGGLVFATPSDRCGQAVDLDTTGSRLAVQTIAEGKPNVGVWDLATGRTVMRATHMPAWIGAVRFDPSGERLLTAGGGGAARIWDASSGRLLVSLEGHTGPVEQAVWFSGGTSVATSSHDGTVRLWDAETGEARLTLYGFGGWPYLAADPTGRYLATSSDGTVGVWALDLDDLVGIAEGRLTRSLTAAECVTYHFEGCPG
jgi:WD40 repeat protein